jgi:hypothetical protein
MPTKQELHKLIDELPDEMTDGIYQAISSAVAATRDDTATLAGLSSSALLRDWASDEDSVYDDD